MSRGSKRFSLVLLFKKQSCVFAAYLANYYHIKCIMIKAFTNILCALNFDTLLTGNELQPKCQDVLRNKSAQLRHK